MQNEFFVLLSDRLSDRLPVNGNCCLSVTDIAGPQTYQSELGVLRQLTETVSLLKI
jgi:hypothetical protein